MISAADAVDEQTSHIIITSIPILQSFKTYMPRTESPFLYNSQSQSSGVRDSTASSSSSASTGLRIYYNKDRWKKQWLRGFLRRFDEIFTQIVPIEDVKDMPTRYKYGVGSMAILGLLGIFIALFVTSYQRQVKQEYLSFLNATHPSSEYCQTIEVPNSGQFMFTQSGYWEGSSNFRYSEASYTIFLTNWQVSQDYYTALMNSLYDNALSGIGINMTKNNLGTNLLYWTSYNQLADQDNAAQRFAPTGDPAVIFDREHVVAHISSKLGVCNASIYTQFLPSESKIYTQTPYSAYLANSICNSTLQPKYFGYIPGVNDETFETQLDIRSLFTAMAVNMGILSFYDIVQVGSMSATLNISGTNYTYSNFYDPKFPGMQPIACISRAGQQFCTIRVGRVFTMPFFHHMGNNTQLPQQCICSELSSAELSEKYNPCNIFNLIAGVIFWETAVSDPLFEILDKYNFSYSTLNDAAYKAAFVSSYWGQTSDNKEYLNSPQYLQDNFAFCDISYGPCSMLTYSAFDTSDNDWAVSKYYFQLVNGACSASLTPTEANWQKLIDKPFSNLIQNYQKCTYSPSYAVFTQFGASVGNLSAATPIFIIVFLALLAFVQSLCGVRIPTIAYHKDEKDGAVEALAVALLRERDRQLHGIAKDDDRYAGSVMKRLVDELAKDGAMYKLTGVEKFPEESFVSPLQQQSQNAIELSTRKTSAIMIMNKSSTTSLKLDGLSPIEDFSSWWKTASLEDRHNLLTTFRDIAYNIHAERFGLTKRPSAIAVESGPTNSAVSDSLYWSIVRDSGVFAHISWGSLMSTSSTNELAKLISEISLLHGCLQMSIASQSQLLKQFGGKLGYRFADCEQSLNDLHRVLQADDQNALSSV